MKEQFPDLDGLHSTLLVQLSGFPEVNISGGYMQEGIGYYNNYVITTPVYRNDI